MASSIKRIYYLLYAGAAFVNKSFPRPPLKKLYRAGPIRPDPKKFLKVQENFFQKVFLEYNKNNKNK
jgi:hypothetical protein